jgi:primosomal protein N'
MFGLLLVVRYLRESDSETVVECRHCGTAVESSADRCATCGREGIVTYEIE